MHSYVPSTSPTGPPPSFLSAAATIAATSRANASLSSIVSGRLMGTTTAASANPLSTANRTRSSWMSAMTTVLAPPALLTAAQSRPTDPAPNTSTVDPAGRDARSRACMATERGSARAPSSRDTPSGSLCFQGRLMTGTPTQHQNHPRASGEGRSTGW